MVGRFILPFENKHCLQFGSVLPEFFSMLVCVLFIYLIFFYTNAIICCYFLFQFNISWTLFRVSTYIYLLNTQSKLYGCGGIYFVLYWQTSGLFNFILCCRYCSMNLTVQWLCRLCCLLVKNLSYGVGQNRILFLTVE